MNSSRRILSPLSPCQPRPRSRTRAQNRRLLLAALPALALAASFPRLASAGSFDDYFKAVQLDDARGVQKLLDRGFDPNTVEAERGDSGMIFALRVDAFKVFDVLLNARGVNLELQARNGDSALLIAAYRGHFDAVKALLAKGAEPNRTGWNALHYGAAVGRNDIVQLLLDNAAYIDAASANGTTPIMMAARGGHILTVKLLLDEGADVALRNMAGLSALDFAQAGNHKDIVEGLTYRLQKAGR
jgi:ankyrin repeat protein